MADQPVSISMKTMDAFQFFVLHSYIRLETKFPVSHRSQLLENLRKYYCPVNWAGMSRPQREVYYNLEHLNTEANARGERLMPLIIEGVLELVQVQMLPENVEPQQKTEGLTVEDLTLYFSTAPSTEESRIESHEAEQVVQEAEDPLE